MAKTAGFCFGVKRALDMAFDIAKKDACTCTLGPIIHNPQVIKKLEDAGIAPVEDIDALKDRKVSSVIIRTHGVTIEQIEELENSEITVIDATCPFVKKAQNYAKLLKEEGYKVVILGNKEHPEVKGLMSYAGDDVMVVDSPGEFKKVRGKVGIVVQTTQQVETLKELISSAVENCKDLKIYNTICNSTALRLKETTEIAGTVDVIIIVGGKNSANTTQLASLCNELEVASYHIETADELETQWFEGAETVFITAGASTPEWIIDEVKERIEGIGGETR